MMTRDEMNAKLRAIIQHCADHEPGSASAIAKELLYGDFTLGTAPEARFAKDAERYRLLRNCENATSLKLWEVVDDGSWGGGTALKQKDALDAALDVELHRRRTIQPTEGDSSPQLGERLEDK